METARLWHNGRVYTGTRYAEALLIDDGRVVAVGSSKEVRRAAPTGTESVDLSGHLIVPGLIDAHLHLGEMTLAREALDVSGPHSVRELVESIRRWAVDHPSGALIGYGWSADRLGRAEPPTRTELDEAVADRPLVLYHASGHAAVVNTAMLGAAGIDRSTPDPAGGRIGRDSDGTPNGALYDAAMHPLDALTTREATVGAEALEHTLGLVLSFGITTVASMGVGREEFSVLRQLEDRGRIPLRIRLYLHVAGLREKELPRFGSPPHGDRLAVTGVKAFTDGAFGPRTAWLSAPYEDAPGETGISVGGVVELPAALQDAASRGLAPALHAIGDRAIERALVLLEPLVGSTPAPARIEHAALTPPELLRRLDSVRPALVIQPGFVWSDYWLAERLGRDRARWAYTFRTLLDRGHLLAGSSDAPCDPLDPWRGLRACVRRRDPEGRSANPDPSEAVPVEEAVRMYTVNGGKVLGELDLGSLEPGARADLLVLEGPDLVDALDAGSGAIREVWVDGVRWTGAKPSGVP